MQMLLLFRGLYSDASKPCGAIGPYFRIARSASIGLKSFKEYIVK